MTEGSNNSGYYTLQAVLTHKGRSSNSGHYVGWVRSKGDTWLKCDDDEVRELSYIVSFPIHFSYNTAEREGIATLPINIEYFIIQ